MSIGLFVQRIYFSLYYIIHRGLLINGWIYPNRFSYARNNFGDDINIPLLYILSGKNCVVKHSTFLQNTNNLLCIGSIIEGFTDEQSIIWGSGAIEGKKKLTYKPKKVCAVRGPLTRQYLLDQGIECPEIYGDPALLMPLIYSPKFEKKFKLGIIPHYSELELPEIKALSDRDDIIVIKMRNYATWQSVIDQIVSCEAIASSSLHGLIISDAYGVPNVHVRLSNNVEGGEFKYRDYYGGVGRVYIPAIDLSERIDLLEIKKGIKSYKPLNYDYKPLLRAFPYKLKTKYKI